MDLFVSPCKLSKLLSMMVHNDNNDNKHTDSTESDSNNSNDADITISFFSLPALILKLQVLPRGVHVALVLMAQV